jgi:hypothetical protein
MRWWPRSNISARAGTLAGSAAEPATGRLPPNRAIEISRNQADASKMHSLATGRFLRVVGAAAAAAILLGTAARGATSADTIPANVHTLSDLACYGGNGNEHALRCWRRVSGFTVVLPAFKAARKPFIDNSVRGLRAVLLPGRVSATLRYGKSWRSPNGDFRCTSTNALFDVHILCSNRSGRGFDLGPFTYRAR